MTVNWFRSHECKMAVLNILSHYIPSKSQGLTSFIQSIHQEKLNYEGIKSRGNCFEKSLDVYSPFLR